MLRTWAIVEEYIPFYFVLHERGPEPPKHPPESNTIRNENAEYAPTQEVSSKPIIYTMHAKQLTLYVVVLVVVVLAMPRPRNKNNPHHQTPGLSSSARRVSALRRPVDIQGVATKMSMAFLPIGRYRVYVNHMRSDFYSGRD